MATEIVRDGGTIVAIRRAGGTRAQRYAAPAYQFGATVGSVLGAKDDVSVITTSIVNILTTIKGSVPYDPSIGSFVALLLFEPLDEVTINLIRYFTFKDLSEQEPRIVVRGVFARRDGDHKVRGQVGYTLVGDPTGRIYAAPLRLDRNAIGGI